MAIRIALFNHKGGVSKTTTTFNLGWMLAEKGKRVLMIDTDPQCNLTGLVMGFKSGDELEQFYETHPERNLRAGLSYAFEARPERIKGIECVEVEGRSGLFLLPGHIRIAEYEVTLGIAQELTASLQPLQNIPGSISALINLTAELNKIDYILIDMSPSLGSINQNLMMTSDYFIIPTAPDYFSVMAISSLETVLPRWRSWAKKAQELQSFQDVTYPFPKTDTKFLGYIVQNYTHRKGVPARAFNEWIQQLNVTIENKLVKTLEEVGMVLPEEAYVGLNPAYCLAQIPDFQSLIAISQDEQMPVFALTPDQLKSSGTVLERYMDMQLSFRAIFEALAERVIRLTNHE